MRSVAAAALAIGILGLVPSAIGAGPKPKPPALGAARILYTSDWGPDQQIYTVDPSGRAHEGQLTFGRSPDCGGWGCVEPLPSPGGGRLPYFGCGASSCFCVSSEDRARPRRRGATPYHCG